MFEKELAEQGFVFVRGPEMRQALAACGPLDDWNAFAGSWDQLEVDEYLVDSGKFRRRRYAVFTVSRGGLITRDPHQPHIQRPEYNVLFGGVERWFEPIADSVAAGATMTTVLRFCQAVFERLATDRPSWHVEVHQFRIEARPDRAGQPTPEGVHRDGVDYVLVLLVNRCNIASGTTTVHDVDGRTLGSFTLTGPLDAALVDDNRVAHGVTPVTPQDPSAPGFRDVLVVTFKGM